LASYRAHVFGGICASALLGLGMFYLLPYRMNWGEVPALFSVTILASLFPDVDTNSKARKWFYWILLFFDLALIFNHSYRWAALLGFFALIPVISRHRGWTHSKWAMMLVPLPIMVIPYLFFGSVPHAFAFYYVGALFGYCSHLVIDSGFR
jgi:hypothetical protein